MKSIAVKESGFSLAELLIVLVIGSLLVGTTLVLVPIQLELRRYQEVNREMDEILDAIVDFVVINGRLPCPSTVAGAGVSGGGGDSACTKVSGFVPWETLGIQGLLTHDSMLADPWGNPYRYYVPSLDVNDDGNADFTFNGQMKEIGIGDKWDVASDPDNPVPGTDGITDLDGQFVICDGASATYDICDGANEVFGNAPTTKGPYQGAVVVLLSVGKNGDELPHITNDADEYENMGTTVEAGYLRKNASLVLGDRRTTFVKRPDGMADDFDDVIKWISPTTLIYQMIDAGQLP